MDEDHIELKDDIEAGHGFVRQLCMSNIHSHITFIFKPSASDGGVCSQVGPPNYVNFCNYSGAAELLKKVLGPINEDVNTEEYDLR